MFTVPNPDAKPPISTRSEPSDGAVSISPDPSGKLLPSPLAQRVPSQLKPSHEESKLPPEISII